MHLDFTTKGTTIAENTNSNVLHYMPMQVWSHAVFWAKKKKTKVLYNCVH